jgi:enoyl-CoA hydratase
MSDPVSGSVAQERHGDVLVLTLSRPPVNAVTQGVMSDIVGIFDSIFADDTVGAVIFTAAPGRVFCGGVDLGERLDSGASRVRAAYWRAVKDSIRQCPVPVIAAVNGICVGVGMGLINTMDIRLAAVNASFGMPEIDVGRAGGAATLRRHVPEGTVRKIMFTGKRISAAEAHHVHLVEEVLADDELLSRALELATDIASKDRHVLHLIKQSLDASELLDPESGYAVEQFYTRQLMSQELTVYSEPKSPKNGN